MAGKGIFFDTDDAKIPGDITKVDARTDLSNLREDFKKKVI